MKAKIIAGDPGYLSEPQEEDQSQTNTNVGNQKMLDKDYYENSHEPDSADPWEQRPRK